MPVSCPGDGARDRRAGATVDERLGRPRARPLLALTAGTVAIRPAVATQTCSEG